MTTFLQDVRFGARQFLRTPSFTVAAVLTLAVGMAATTTAFSFVNAIVLQPLAYPGSDRVVMVVSASRTAIGIQPTTAAPGDFLDWQAQSTSFEHMAAFMNASASVTGDAQQPERLRGLAATPRLFETLGVAPVLGRTLAASEGDASAAQMVVISHGLWTRRFAANPSVIGRPIALNQRTYIVAGVAPAGFAFPRDLPLGVLRDPRPVDVWMPLELKAGDRSTYILEVVGRVRSDRTVPQAAAEMEAIAAAIAEQVPRSRNRTVVLEPLHERIVGDVRPLLFVLAGAGAFVLLIACANVANLMLARGAERQREVAIRAALGAGRWRIARQFMTESLLLGVAGSGLGLLAAVWGVAFVSDFVPPGATPRLTEVDVDMSVLAFAFVLALVAPLCFGAIPAALMSRSRSPEALKEAAPSMTSGSRLRYVLVAAEVALAFVLVVGAGLLIESFARMTRVGPGFERDRVLTVTVTLPEASYETTGQMAAFIDAVLDGVRTVPTVTHAGVVNWLPIGGTFLSGGLVVEGTEFPPGLAATKTAASGEYFSAMGIPLVRGRTFAETDRDDESAVVIVTEGLARAIWGDRDAIGQRLKIGFGRPDEQPWRIVVGIVGDVRQMGLTADTSPAVYFPPAQSPVPFLLREGLTFTVRTSGEPQDVASAVVGQVRRVDPNLPIDRVIAMRDLVANSIATPRFRGVIFGTFALTALILVASGIVGVLAYTVSRRTKEIGLRIALGAERAHVLGLVVRQAVFMTAAGLLVGIIAARALTRLIGSYLYDVTTFDPMVLGVAAFLLLGLAVAAAYLPARRAANLNPLQALRSE